MSTHKFTDRLTLTFSLGGGEDHEVEVDVKYTFSPGSPAMWVKSIGTWDPPDPAEIELTQVVVPDDGNQFRSKRIPDWIFAVLYDDVELKGVLECRALDELNRGPDD